MAEEPTLSSLAATSGNSTPTESKFSTGPSSSSGPVKTREQLRKHYIRSLHKVIDESDIVLMVLDARDPEGCRSRLVEEEVRRRESDGKRLIFVLNKIGASDILVHGTCAGSHWLFQISFRKRMRRHGCGISATLPLHSLSARPHNISGRSCPRPPHLR